MSKTKRSKKGKVNRLKLKSKSKKYSKKQNKSRVKSKSKAKKTNSILKQGLKKVKAKIKQITNPKAFQKKGANTKLSQATLNKISEDIARLKKEIRKTVVGQEGTVNGLIIGLLTNGHVLIESLPGTAKTLLINSFAQATGCLFKRIQFTVDLLPTDITGFTSYDAKKGFYTVKGPIFANFVMADEVNRAPPKTQSAMLEAMQERKVTIGKETFKLPAPFFIMATQNPIESGGTYPLPEAQIDRFLLKLKMFYPEPEDEQKILTQNITLRSFEDFKINPVWDPKSIIEIQNLVKEVYMSTQIEKYIVHLVHSTRFPKKYGIKLGKFLSYGGSPRASIALFIASKAMAIIDGKSYVTPQHIKTVAHHVLRHRMILNYEGQAEGIDHDTIVDEILQKVKVP